MSLLTSLPASAHRPLSPETMAETARSFIASLTPEQIAKTEFPFENEERKNWHFIPRERKGLALKDMTPPQKHLASALLSAGLSQRGYIKATTIMSLEDILRILEKDDGVRRNPDGYYFSIFGTPSEKGTWGYRVEGHHLSLNFTLANGKVSGSPNFLGANPAEVREGPRKGLRVLHAEEDLGRAVIAALTPEQKKVAIVAKEAYKDILTMVSRDASLKGQPSGLQASKMNAKQKALLQELIEEYTNNLPDDVAKTRLEKVRKAGTNLFFAWAGGENRGDPHYYRVQGPDFLIEYDNTQNGANHIHSVWRDLNGDFGEDLLKQHYGATHSKGNHNH
jgi:Protein of unknown function (DUF3500)